MKILFVVVGLVIGSCSQSEIEEEVLKPSVEQVQMEELIQYVEDIKPYVPAPLDVHTRGFWSSFRSWFKNLGKADAGGYRWGRDNGMNFWRGLRVSLTTSLVTAINGGMLELPGRQMINRNRIRTHQGKIKSWVIVIIGLSMNFVGRIQPLDMAVISVILLCHR